MSRKDFERDCALLEDAGWIMTEIQPFAKYSRYVKNGAIKIIGKRKPI